MKTLSIFIIFLFSALVIQAKTLRVAAYNVEFGKGGSAEEFGNMLKEYKLDIVTFNEAPGEDWTKKVGEACGMKFHYVGKTSSANHKDKYKSILSKTPLTDTSEVLLEGSGWSPASAVRASTVIDKVSYTIYSLHIPGSSGDKKNGAKSGTKAHSLTKILSKDKSPNIIAMGDYNSRVEQNPIKAILRKGFKYTWEDLKTDLKKEKTWNVYNNKGEGVIDHILYKLKDKKVKVTDGGIIKLEKPLSDHAPVWAEFSFE